MPNLGFESLDHYAMIRLGDPNTLTEFHQTLFKHLQQNIEVTGDTFDEKIDQCRILRKDINSYLRRLNADKRLPLPFRMHVMSLLQNRCRTYFDTDCIHLLLKSYQIAISLLPFDQVKYHIEILNLSIAAIKVAIFDIQVKRKEYHSADHKNILLAYQILKDIFPIVTYLGVYHPQRLAEFGRCLCWYEFLRGMDFFSQSIDMQNDIINRLHLFMNDIEVTFYENGETMICSPKKSYFIIHPTHPEKTIKLQTGLQDHTCQHDSIVLDVSQFLSTVSHVSEHSKSKKTQEACRHIHKALLLHAHQLPRCTPDTQMTVLLALQALDALNFKQLFDTDSPPNFIDGVNQHWVVVNYSKIGVCLKRKRSKEVLTQFKGGTLIGMQWKEKPDDLDYQYQLGFLRWQKRDREAEYIGIEFFNIEHSLVCATFHNESIVVMQEKNQDNVFWLPLKKVKVDEKLYLYGEQGGSFYNIDKIKTAGQNFCRCEMEQASY